jgi:hypothetical protein
VGINFIFWVPALVVSVAGIFARLAIALPVFEGPGVPDIVQVLQVSVVWLAAAAPALDLSIT